MATASVQVADARSTAARSRRRRASEDERCRSPIARAWLDHGGSRGGRRHRLSSAGPGVRSNRLPTRLCPGRDDARSLVSNKTRQGAISLRWRTLVRGGHWRGPRSRICPPRALAGSRSAALDPSTHQKASHTFPLWDPASARIKMALQTTMKMGGMFGTKVLVSGTAAS